MSSRRRKPTMKDRIHETFGSADEPLPEPDGRGRVLEAIVAVALGTGFCRLVVSDSWTASLAFGAVLAGLLLAYGLLRTRIVADRDDAPPR